jgi:hypothetical protein
MTVSLTPALSQWAKATGSALRATFIVIVYTLTQVNSCPSCADEEKQALAWATLEKARIFRQPRPVPFAGRMSA